MVFPCIVAAGFSKIFVDHILIQHATSWLVPLLIGMAVTALFRAMLTMLRQSLLLRLQNKLAVVMISRFLWHVMALPVEFFTQRHAGDIASRVSANEQIARLLSSGVAANALNLTSIVIFAAAMAIYDLPLAAIGVGMSLMNVVALRFIGGRRQDVSRSLALERGKLVGATVSAVRTIETLKASGLEDEAFGQWAGIQAKALNAEQELGVSSTMLDMLPTLLSGLTTAAILGFGGWRVIEGSLTLGSLVAFQSLMASFSEPVTELVNYAGSVQTIKGALERLEDVYNYPLDRSDRKLLAADRFPPKLTGRVELDNIQFGYSILEPPLLAHLSIAIAPGSRVALVGASGSGKSTLAKLICGLYKPWSGEIRIDGWTLPEIPPQVFANSIAYVDQDVLLFEGTARDNLTLWDPTVTEADLSQALKDAVIHEDIAARVGNLCQRGRHQFQRRPAPAHRNRPCACFQSFGHRDRQPLRQHLRWHPVAARTGLGGRAARRTGRRHQEHADGHAYRGRGRRQHPVRRPATADHDRPRGGSPPPHSAVHSTTSRRRSSALRSAISTLPGS